MATDQGKTSNVPGLAIMANALGKPIPEVGTTRFRPPFAPVSIGSLAAERYGEVRPERLTPMHDWHVEQRRDDVFGRPLAPADDLRPCPARRSSRPMCAKPGTTRESAGIVDVSTLGKIAVQGPDAADFLDRVYTNMFSTLPVGKARYGLMLREDGHRLRRRHDLAARRARFPDDHDHGQCRQGHAASRISARRRLARPQGPRHLGHRPVGGRGDRRPEGARNPRRLRHRHRGRQRRPALHGHRAWRDRRRAGDDLPPVLLRRNGLRGLLRRRPRHRMSGRR